MVRLVAGRCGSSTIWLALTLTLSLAKYSSMNIIKFIVKIDHSLRVEDGDLSIEDLP